ncbi:MAG: hypothetical protein AB7O96_20180 [Pseudobdellovibrionaceae bacterium]
MKLILTSLFIFMAGCATSTDRSPAGIQRVIVKPLDENKARAVSESVDFEGKRIKEDSNEFYSVTFLDSAPYYELDIRVFPNTVNFPKAQDGDLGSEIVISGPAASHLVTVFDFESRHVVMNQYTREFIVGNIACLANPYKEKSCTITNVKIERK